ncbi:hypothetical protein DFQ28_004942 [Apophysomyces sp. BC1034]|nr:hypothetical protein DFQ30_000986 [Apophysomyces sp. BC1015]KAG0180612.1 hypothetical protein DFQ29_000322 [Apophysomyces sp. BC1021]KAG0188366.1 hypothetical protein DFQ28_004942 [Apophysomyces sp. BC1034]
MRLSHLVVLFLAPASLCAAIQGGEETKDAPMEVSNLPAENPRELFYQLTRDVKTIAEEVVKRLNEGLVIQAQKSGKPDAPTSLADLAHNMFNSLASKGHRHEVPVEVEMKAAETTPAEEEKEEKVAKADATNGRNEGLSGAFGSLLNALGSKIGNPLNGPIAALIGGEFGQLSNFFQGVDPFTSILQLLETLFANTPLASVFSAISKLISVITVLFPIIKQLIQDLINNQTSILSQATRNATLNMMKLAQFVVGPNRQLMPDDIYYASEAVWDTVNKLYPDLRMVTGLAHQVSHSFFRSIVTQDPTILELLSKPTPEKVESAIQAVGRVLRV